MRMNTCILEELNGITLASQNIRSLSSKVDDIATLVSRTKLDLLALQEMFLDGNTDDAFIDIDHYSLHRLDIDRLHCKSSGGVLVVYSNKYEFEQLHDWSISCKSLEILWIKLSLKDTRPTYIANAYRPPDGVLAEALQLLDDQITSLQSQGLSDIVVLGDLNVDLLVTNCKSRALNQSMASNLMTQSTELPIRITNTTRSLIDHAWVSNANFYASSGSLDVGLSDHHLIYVSRHTAKIKQSAS